MSALTLAAVSDAVLKSRGGAHGSWPWSRKLLAAADAQFSGAWREVEIDAERALAIRLPPHAGEPCKGDQLTLVPAPGGSVREAAATLAKVAAAYARHNESCMGRLTFAADAPFSHVVLCTAPLDADDYRQVSGAPGDLYCVDGVHRLIAWAWRERLSPGVTLPAFVIEKHQHEG